ncbi:hypothetical protein [Modestobacter sp. DSM 44400]|uniref:hypothetical protein n=1 Tax=Modestobacter sp. DSM 44400 TaxID=1550230 RepID=UPI0015877BE5|nr:hypothetical protein [Modestobacter sp. DSM 44400]
MTETIASRDARQIHPACLTPGAQRADVNDAPPTGSPVWRRIADAVTAGHRAAVPF